MLNMGYFDITNDIPVFIDIHGAENRNKEVSTLMDTIKKYPNRFKNVILIGDRKYFTYMLMTFLIEHLIRFVIKYIKAIDKNINVFNGKNIKAIKTFS